jgi:hypothetical protein
MFYDSQQSLNVGETPFKMNQCRVESLVVNYRRIKAAELWNVSWNYLHYNQRTIRHVKSIC